jgi:uroporphyrinogen III methyltransferase / synthase
VATLLDLAPTAAERISVGKAPKAAEMTQDEINELLVAKGRSVATVVRLKGGDPFVFARGGEEAAYLATAGVPFQVVPGVTSAIAVPAYAGIPVTLRHSSTSFTVVTGHEDPAKPGGAEGTVDWEAVARLGGTIIILMGVARIAQIAERLLGGGLAPGTPVAAVTWGTRAAQRTVRTTLGAVGTTRLDAPATIVVGEVAAQELGWFESRPLFGRRVVVTRSREQASELSGALRDLGAEVVELPAIAIADPDDGGDGLRAAAARVRDYDWLALTSPNGARRFLACLPDARALAGVSVAAIGPGTAAALAAGGIRADLVPERFVAESLLDAFPEPPGVEAGSGRVLVARAAVARDVLPSGLTERGWKVDVVEAYRTVTVAASDSQLASAGSADAVTFTSSSTVENYLRAAGADHVPPVVAAIGPVTAATARSHGLTVTVEATEHTIAGLVEAVVAYFAGRPPRS